MTSVEILRKAVKSWDGHSTWNGRSVPEDLVLIFQIVGLKAACGGYNALDTLEITSALEELAQKTISRC